MLYFYNSTESFTQYETVYNSRLECCSGYDGYDCLRKSLV